MKAQYRFWIAVLILPLALAGCKGATDKEYDVKGKVVAVNPDKPSVTLDHEDIPGLMNAMTMEFDVADRKLLEGIKAGDQIQGRLKKQASGNVITQLEKR